MSKVKLQSRKFWILVFTTIALFVYLWFEKLDSTTFGLLMGFLINGYWAANVAQKHVEMRSLTDVVADKLEE